VRAITADLLLLAVALIWGSTFVIVKEAISLLPPFTFLAWRFTLAFFTLLPFAWSSWRRWQWMGKQGGQEVSGTVDLHKGEDGKSFRAVSSPLGAGILLGLFLFGGYAFQTLGLQYTTPARAGFITGLSVVLVPLLGTILWRERPGLFAALGSVLALIGLALLSLQDGWLALSWGDFLVLLCALSFALHILGVGHLAVRFDPNLLTLIQVGLVALLSFFFIPLEFRQQPPALWPGPTPFQSALGPTAASVPAGEVIPAVMPAGWTLAGGTAGKLWGALLLTGILATSLAFLLQNHLQRYTSATHTALIFATEPVFAALFSFLWTGEILPPQGLVGGALVVAGMVLAELGDRKPALIPKDLPPKGLFPKVRVRTNKPQEK